MCVCVCVRARACVHSEETESCEDLSPVSCHVSKSVRHHGLSLSEGNRKATLTEPLSSNDDPIMGTFVLVGQPLTGHCYWEVEWSGLSVGLGVFHNLEIDRFSQFKSFFMQCYGHGKCVFTNKLPTVV